MRWTAIAATHVLFAGLALAAVSIWGAGADPGRVRDRVTLPDPDPRLPVVTALSIVRPPGTLVLDTTKLQLGAPLNKVMSDREAAALDTRGAVEVKAQVTRDDGISQGVWQVAIRNGANRRAVLRAADRLYASVGWRLVPYPVPGVLVRKQSAAAGQPLTAYRAHYLYGPYLIRIEAYGTDATRVDRDFADLAGRQLAASPPAAR
jgi:hypothetical protein